FVFSAVNCRPSEIESPTGEWFGRYIPAFMAKASFRPRGSSHAAMRSNRLNGCPDSSLRNNSSRSLRTLTRQIVTRFPAIWISLNSTAVPVPQQNMALKMSAKRSFILHAENVSRFDNPVITRGIGFHCISCGGGRAGGGDHAARIAPDTADQGAQIGRAHV